LEVREDKMSKIAMFGYSKKFKINGRTREFTTHEAYTTKEEADIRAEEIRVSGYYVRIEKASAVPGVGRKYTYKLFIYPRGGKS
jgi:hypothetical protein